MLEEDKHMLIEGEIVPDFPGGTASCEPFTLSSIRSKKVLLCFYAWGDTLGRA
jgi:peroxiredoxin